VVYFNNDTDKLGLCFSISAKDIDGIFRNGGCDDRCLIVLKSGHRIFLPYGSDSLLKNLLNTMKGEDLIDMCGDFENTLLEITDFDKLVKGLKIKKNKTNKIKL
jgi:hypothetical protein